MTASECPSTVSVAEVIYVEGQPLCAVHVIPSLVGFFMGIAYLRRIVMGLYFRSLFRGGLGTRVYGF